MQVALPARLEPQLPSEPAAFNSRQKRALLAGLALAGASVIAVNPVAPALPALAELNTRAVQLSAWSDPLTTWQNTLATSFGHIQYGLNEISTSYPLYGQWLAEGTPVLFQELASTLTNAEGWQNLADKLPAYGERIQAAIQASLDGSQGGVEQGPSGIEALGEVLQTVTGYLQEGQFNYALAAFNEYFLWSAGAGAWPLFDLFQIPADIATDLGATNTARVLNTLLNNDALSALSLAAFGPIVTGAFQFTESLDDIAAAAKANDWEAAVIAALDTPGKALNAYLNGYIPRVAIENGQPWAWPGLLTNKGTLEHFLFNLPRDLAWAIGNPQPSTEGADIAALTEVTSTDVLASTEQSGAKFVTLDLDSAVSGTDSGESSATRTAGSLAENTLTAKLTAPITEAGAALGKAIGLSKEAPAAEAGADSAGAAETGGTGANTTVTEGESEPTKSDATKSDSGKSGTKSGKFRFGKSKSDTTKSETKKSDASNSGNAGNTKPDSPRTDNAKSDSAKSDTAKSVTAKSDGGRSDGGRSTGKQNKGNTDSGE